MKENYQLLLDKIIEGLDKRPTLLLHSCCGPCSSYVLEYISKYFDITLYYYNPCIYPKEEYYKRLDTQKKLLEITNDALFKDRDYDHTSFLSAVKGYENEIEGGARCELCFKQRIYESARVAKENGFDFFATTLTVSPHKNAELLNKICKEAEELYGVCALPSDFKKRNGYKRSVELSKKYDLYRQSYCGCEFSKAQAEKNLQNKQGVTT